MTLPTSPIRHSLFHTLDFLDCNLQWNKPSILLDCFIFGHMDLSTKTLILRAQVCLCICGALQNTLFFFFYLCFETVEAYTRRSISALICSNASPACARSRPRTCLSVTEGRWVYPSLPVHFLEIMTAISSSQ